MWRVVDKNGEIWGFSYNEQAARDEAKLCNEDDALVYMRPFLVLPPAEDEG